MPRQVAGNAPPEDARGRRQTKTDLDQVGYRVTPAQRREMDVARGFVGARSHQDLIDMAVREYLRRLRQDDADYRVAAEALDRVLRRGSTNVAQMP